MDDAKPKDFEKTRKKKQGRKVQTGMVAVHVVRVRHMTVKATAKIQVRAPQGSTTNCAVRLRRIMHFPKDSPYLNAVEECQRQVKHRLLVSEYCRTLSDMCRAVLHVLSNGEVPS